MREFFAILIIMGWAMKTSGNEIGVVRSLLL